MRTPTASDRRNEARTCTAATTDTMASSRRKVPETPERYALSLSCSCHQRRVHHCQGAGALDVIHTRDAQNGAQSFRGNFHRSGLGRHSGLRLRKRGRHCSMESDVALNLLNDLMDVAVEHGHGAKTFEITKRLLA